MAGRRARERAGASQGESTISARQQSGSLPRPGTLAGTHSTEEASSDVWGNYSPSKSGYKGKASGGWGHVCCTTELYTRKRVVFFKEVSLGAGFFLEPVIFWQQPSRLVYKLHQRNTSPLYLSLVLLQNPQAALVLSNPFIARFSRVGAKSNFGCSPKTDSPPKHKDLPHCGDSKNYGGFW